MLVSTAKQRCKDSGYFSRHQIKAHFSSLEENGWIRVTPDGLIYFRGKKFFDSLTSDHPVLRQDGVAMVSYVEIPAGTYRSQTSWYRFLCAVNIGTAHQTSAAIARAKDEASASAQRKKLIMKPDNSGVGNLPSPERFNLLTAERPVANRFLAAFSGSQISTASRRRLAAQKDGYLKIRRQQDEIKKADGSPAYFTQQEWLEGRAVLAEVLGVSDANKIVRSKITHTLYVEEPSLISFVSDLHFRWRKNLAVTEKVVRFFSSKFAH